MSERVGALFLEYHFATLEHRAFADENHGIIAGVLSAILVQELRKLLYVELVLRNHAAVGGACHCRQHRSETCVPTEDFHDQEPFMGPGGGSQHMRNLNRTSDAGAEADA